MKKYTNYMLLAQLMMAAASEHPFATGRGSRSYFDDQAARERDFKVHDRDNDRQLRPFKVKGKTVMAYSKKDAIKRLKHMK